ISGLAKTASARNTTSLPSFCCRSISGRSSSSQSSALWTLPDRSFASRQSPSRRSEEHTSELQSLRHLVCRLLLEKIDMRKIELKKDEEGVTRIALNGELLCQCVPLDFFFYSDGPPKAPPFSPPKPFPD